jgi:hypothetical protein
MNIYYIQYNIRPLPDSEDFKTADGAFLICFIQAESAQKAITKALSYINEIHWEMVSLEDGPDVVRREEFVDSDPEWLEAYDAAVRDGEFHALYVWDNDEHGDHESH